MMSRLIELRDKRNKKIIIFEHFQNVFCITELQRAKKDVYFYTQFSKHFIFQCCSNSGGRSFQTGSKITRAMIEWCRRKTDGYEVK